jgi:hypothetical protein
LPTAFVKGRSPIFVPFFAMPVDTDIYDFLPFFLHHRQECRIRQGFSRFRLPPSTQILVHYIRA